MPEVFSLSMGAACCIGYAALQSCVGRGSAVSTEAQAVEDFANKIIANAERSEALFGGKASAISRLRELAAECSSHDWDGYGALPANPLAVAFAERFIRALPEEVALPEFAIEPEGSISLDWIESQHRLFSVSVGPRLRLAFAWLDGSDRGHGVARFDMVRIPGRILDGIRSITSQFTDARLWAA
jgi:hypothetical protein